MKKLSLKIKRLNLSKGQSLFEVLLAIGVIAVVVTAVVSLSATTITNNSFSKDNTLSNRYAQEAIDWIRMQRDQSFDDLKARAGIYCLATLDWGISGYCSTASNHYISETGLRREVFLQYVSPNEIRVEVTVFWDDSTGRHVVESHTVLTDWRYQ